MAIPAGILSMKSLHSDFGVEIGGADLRQPLDDRIWALPPVRQALVRVNPVNGRKSVYVGSHASHIEGMPEEEGRAT